MAGPQKKGQILGLRDEFVTSGLFPMADIAGTPGNDTLIGTAAAERIFGYAGNDLIIGVGGADELHGGLDDDVYIIDDASAQVFELSGEGRDVIYTRLSYSLAAGQYVEALAADNPSATIGLTLTGNELAQDIAGTAGADTLFGRGGADLLVGRGGDDIYIVDDPNAFAYEVADEGRDTVYARVSYGLRRGHHIEALAADDPTSTTGLTLIGNELAQDIAGTAGADLLIGLGGADLLIGRGGNDVYVVEDAAARVYEEAGGGQDVVYARVSYALAGGAEVEALAADNPTSTLGLTLTGNELAQHIAGTAGADTLTGVGGADLLIGRGGDDTYIIDDAAALVYEEAGGGNDTIRTKVSYGLARGLPVESLQAFDPSATTALTLMGNELAQTITGNAGGNVLIGLGGADILQGLGGDDTYIIDDAAVQIVEAEFGGRDTVFAKVNYTLAAGVHVDVLAADNPASTTGITLIGNEFTQTIVGTAGNDTLIAAENPFYLRQSEGRWDVNDTLYGGLGDDTYYVQRQNMFAFEKAGEGTDTLILNGADSAYILQPGTHIEVLVAYSNPDPRDDRAYTLFGNELAQTFIGNSKGNVFHGNGGADIMRGGLGNDIYWLGNNGQGTQVIEAVGEGRDSVGVGFSYTLAAGSEIEGLQAANGTQAIDLTGNEFAQGIQGNDGANVLNGMGGSDELVGWGGADSFVFSTALGPNNIDSIFNFASGSDKLLLDDAIFTGLAPGALPASAFVAGTAALDADDRVIFDQTTGKIFFDADGSGSGAAIEFAFLRTGSPPQPLVLTASDIIVI